MKRFNKVLLTGVMFFLPLVILIGAVNFTARMPDFYQYEFNSARTAKAIGVSIKNDELAGLFSDFMWGMSQELALEVPFAGDEMSNIFLEEEERALGRLRTILNAFSLAGAVIAMAVAGSYYVLLRDGDKKELRRAFLLSVPVLLAFDGALAALLLLSVTGGGVEAFFLGGPLPESGALLQMLSRALLVHGVLTAVALSLILYIIAGMITWSLTKPYRMFGPMRR